MTFFLLNAELLKLIEAKLSTVDFRCEAEGCRTVDKNTPESAVAYDEVFIRGLYEKHRLGIVEPIHYGAWCRRGNFLYYQDIVVAVKK